MKQIIRLFLVWRHGINKSKKSKICKMKTKRPNCSLPSLPPHPARSKTQERTGRGCIEDRAGRRGASGGGGGNARRQGSCGSRLRGGAGVTAAPRRGARRTPVVRRRARAGVISRH